jgi:hypothetical protein
MAILVIYSPKVNTITWISRNRDKLFLYCENAVVKLQIIKFDKQEQKHYFFIQNEGMNAKASNIFLLLRGPNLFALLCFMGHPS